MKKCTPIGMENWKKNSFACQCLCVATEDNSGYEQLLVYLRLKLFFS